MSAFRNIVEAPGNSKFVLQGNAAFALGVVHAGYHAADGYPGTPSTEVIDRSLAHVQDRIQVGWSVNEAVAVSVCLGRAIAGYDSVVTMKIPGVFQAGDAISTSAFFTAPAGALVIFAATDYDPSSTQHVIDARHFLSSARLPVLEPRDHQEMYEIAWTAADMSREFHTPVVVLASGILAHSEGLITTQEPRAITPRAVPENLHNWMLLPSIARKNYNKATQERIPLIQAWTETSNLVEEIEGSEDWGVIVSGESNIIVKEALQAANARPPMLSLAITNPLPKGRIKAFAKKIEGKLFVIEDGDKFLQDKVALLDVDVIGKDEYSTLTNWTPGDVLELLSKHTDIQYKAEKKRINIKPIARPPSICPGCAYKALTLCVAKLKKKKKIFAIFGDIGCSTLLYFFNALDTASCMGASDSMRQGFVMSHPEMASKTISIIGDSCECHSGLDSTRNAVFRNVPGVKIILDNRITAMTGGQPSPSSEINLEQQLHKFNLRKAVEAEVERTVVVDAFNLDEIDKELKKALALAEKGEFSALIVEGACIQEIENNEKIRTLQIDYDKCKCKTCLLSDICPGIELGDDNLPRFTNLCTNCGSNPQICMQYCPFDAVVPLEEARDTSKQQLPKPEEVPAVTVGKDKLPESLRVAIRGIGGQGILFFGRVLSEVAKRTPYSETHIIKGDTHGMAQLGGPVISTFGCGQVYSPIPAPNSVDVLVVMEVSEVLRPGFLDLLKPDGTIIFNEFTALPVNVKREDYPDPNKIEKALENYNLIKVDANKMAYDLGDESGRIANVIVIGLLSTIEPFDNIPEEIWLSALMSVSPTDFIKSANQTAFKSGRSYHE
ncbi:MAG: pyruvate ferredoxin oxidoreductase [Candidatus Latescibacteria bacterium]|nr:pyruvate ferredoxin oxidoreductase [Candidatus Latescibacterota bacterium]NIM64462.1 pyruvate ferredoxin oxidoreductase [Candidatus Latescibacterota bacterium]NIO00615.1 pyruvate ferredoxin oxidoreductase [Candidatus Latescibacterota bacterium]NIO27016.1 pyruvate ferredoxin oxidoreductase [Candidatus Latescibacterota bacterium]NIO56093.1 pyruvate ferredoxin oxidoreductase [Candidatus Latescibacterota bacterium]